MSVVCGWGVDSLIASDKQDVWRGESVNELAVMDWGWWKGLDPRAEDVSIEGDGEGVGGGESAAGIPLTIAAPLMQCLVALPKPWGLHITTR